MLAAPPFSYLETLDRVDDAIESNAELARAIVRHGLQSFGVVEDQGSAPAAVVPEEWAGIAKPQDLDKARSTIRQFYRDWSAEGAVEREACYGPVFRTLDAERERLKQKQAQNQSESAQQPQQQQQPEVEDQEPMKILVPGAGLGRLVFELCRRGFLAEGNEISYHQLLASSYVLNYTERAGQHAIYPWIHTFSNHRSRASQFRSYAVPDVHPQGALSGAPPGTVGSMQMCAADFLCLYGDDTHRDAYDAVAAVFFLDTAPNLIRYLQVIHRCLRPGGLLINVGPLLWHWENHVQGHQGYDGDGEGEEEGGDSLGIADPGSFELTDDEVVALVERLGFIIEKHETDKEAPYVQDPNSMLRTVYRASHWVARKPEV